MTLGSPEILWNSRLVELEDTRRILARHHPELATKTIQGPQMGTSNWCFEVDGCWVFRFPKNEESAIELRREILALGLICSQLPARVPDFVFVHQPSAEFPLPYVGYELIVGKPLLPERLVALGPARRRVFATELGCFLTLLHQTPLEELEQQADYAGISFRDQPLFEWSRKDNGSAEPCLAAVLERLRGDPDHPRLLELCGPYLVGEPDVLAEEQCLIHGDLSEHHLLHDPATGSLLGVIDFGNVKIDDPWSDFLNLMSCFDLDFSLQVLETYSRPSAPLIRRKLELFTLLRDEPGDLLHKLFKARRIGES